MLGRISIGLVLGALTVFSASAQDIQKGAAAYKRGDYATAPREMGPLAAAGNARAQNNIGLMFLKGHGIPQDYAEAVTWFRKAAGQSYVSAQYNLGVMYLRGRGVPQDYAEAVTWFLKAAGKGHTRAQYNLALMYLKGDGVPRNYAEAETWFRAAAAQGHAGARKILASVSRKGPEPEDKATPPAAGKGEVEAEESPPSMSEKPSGSELETPEMATRGGAYVVQLGAVKTEAVAAQEAERLNNVHAAVLGGLKIEPVRADLGERGVYYRLRAGPFEERAAATALCGELSAREQACLVVKP